MVAESPEKVYNGICKEKTLESSEEKDQNHTKKEETLFSPPKRRNIYTETRYPSQPVKVEFSWFRKLMSLPRIRVEVTRTFNLYEQTKNSYVYLGAALSLSEWILIKFWTVIMAVLFMQPVADMTYYFMSKVKVLDDFMCHQLDFVEDKLSTMDTSIIYKSGGVIDRVLLAAHLTARITFFFPRITWRIIRASFAEFNNEISESIDMGLKIVMPQTKPRRSRRKPVQKSPSHKRKHDERELVEDLPDYLVCVDYREEDDPDFEPRSDDDTEVTSASEHSVHDSDDNTDEYQHEKIVHYRESPTKTVEINENIDSVQNTNLVSH